MADLEFKHHVDQVPSGESLPNPVKRSVEAEVSRIPDFQSAYNNYAADTNWMSSVGSRVAQSSSNQLAKQLGTQLGQKPQGDLGVSLTQFDANLTESYNAQSHATLGLQASKLITDSQIELSKAPRLSPDLVAKQQQQVMLGLKNIYAAAPNAIKPQLESQYSSALQNQRVQLEERMIGDARKDERENIVAYSNNAAEQAYNLSATGDEEGAKKFVETTKKMTSVGVMNHTLDKDSARVYNETAEKSYLSGRETKKAMDAKKQNKLPEHLKNYAEHPPSDMNYSQWQSVGASVLQNVQFYDSLEKQDQAAYLSRLNLAMVTNPGGINNDLLTEARNRLPETVFNDWKVSYLKYSATHAKGVTDVQNAIAVISDPDKYPLLDTKTQYKAIQAIAQQNIEDAAQKGESLSMPEAMMQAAATAAGPNKQYVSTLNAKAKSNSPVNLQEVSAAVEYMNKSGSAQNLDGLSDKSRVSVEMFNSLSGSHDPVTAAQMVHDSVITPKTDQQLNALENNWNQHLKDNTVKGITPESFALSVANVPVGSLVNPSLVGDMVKQKYHAYFMYANGNTEVAQKMLQEDMEKTFGVTNVNGANQYDMYPIEKLYKLPTDALPMVHEDLLNQFSDQVKRTKELYDSGASSFYYEVRRDVDIDSAVAASKVVHDINTKQLASPVSKGIFDITMMRPEKLKAEKTINEYKNSLPKVVRHFNDGRTEEYQLAIRGNYTLGTTSVATTSHPISGYYDVVLKNDKGGLMPITTANPHDGPVRYAPRKDRIMNNYYRMFPNYSDVDLKTLTERTLSTIAAHGK